MKEKTWFLVVCAIVLVIVSVAIMVGCFFAMCWLGARIEDWLGMGGVIFGAATMLAFLLRPFILND